MKRTPALLVTLFLFWTVIARAQIVAISEPNLTYQAETTKIDISALPFDSLHESISDGTLQVSFSSPMLKRGPVPSGWSTWSSPPFSESPTPHVLASNRESSMTWTFDQTVGTFGFELEPNLFENREMTVDFILSLDNVVIGTIRRTINGLGGARLIAAQTSGAPFDRIDIMGGEFAVAQIRYALLTLVTMDLKPGDSNNRVNLGSRGVAPIVIRTLSLADGDTTAFNAMDVNPSTLQLGPAAAQPWRWSLLDIEGDGDLDLELRFRVPELGLSCGDTEITLRGATYGGIPFWGRDSIETMGCNGNARGQNLQR